MSKSARNAPLPTRLRALCAAGAVATLAACAQGNSSADLAPAAPQAAAAQPAAPQQAAAPPPKAALTPEEAKGQCWMKYENDRRAKGIDERLRLVEKCVDDTLRDQLVQRPAR